MPAAMQILRTIVNHFLFPPGINLLLLFAGLVLLRRAPRAGRAFLWTGCITLWLLAMPVVSSALMRATGTFAAYTGGDRSARAIVILAAERRDGPDYAGGGVGPRTLERLQMGAHWARATGLPVLVSGGREEASDPDSMARRMDRAMRGEFGLTVRWLEEGSRNTWENAQRSADILRAAGIARIVLVTHYVHMQRAVADFTAAGIEVVPAPTGLPSFSLESLSPGTAAAAVWPKARCLEDSALALHELYGLAGRALGLAV
jgi:uncharacterized SAM-binding protein YcdF (DUF218 family)